MKKRILSFLLAFSMLLSLVSCASLENDDWGYESGLFREETEGETEEILETGPITIPESFAVGYAKKAVNPEEGVGLGGYGTESGRLSKRILDDILVTSTAISDGENIFLFIGLDALFVSADMIDSVAKRVGKLFPELNIPAENIIMNATHTHAGVGISYEWEKSKQYREEFNKAAAKAATDALADQAKAELYFGNVETEGMAFVRHYTTNAGGICGANFGQHGSGYSGHAREADQELQLVRFEREGKKDVLLMSFPSHATFMEMGNELSADYPGYARSYVEKNNEDMLVAFFQGASGDQVPTSRIGSENFTKDCKTHGEKLGQYALDAISGLKKIENSEVKLATKTYEGKTNTHGADKVWEARSIQSLANQHGSNSAAVKTALAQAGFANYYEANWIALRADYYNTPTYPMDLRVLSIGDGLGFIFAPYEMFAPNGQYIKEHTPGAMTFVVTCSENPEGHMGYMPHEYACEESFYEYDVTKYERGSGEKLAELFAQTLTEMKNAG